MEFQSSKHVKIVVDLEVNETVRVKDWGYKLENIDCVITDIKKGNSESGILVKINKYENYLDSNWISKIYREKK